MKHFLSFCLIVGLAVLNADARAQNCSTDKAHEFDFWIGDWDVTAGGQTAGTNLIEPILDGCVLQENWVGAGGSKGSSFSYYDPQKKQWEQFWVWRNGTTLYNVGQFEDGKMILKGESTNPKGQKQMNRITWSASDDGSVRQFWEISTDDGETWQVAFDGHYTRKG